MAHFLYILQVRNQYNKIKLFDRFSSAVEFPLPIANMPVWVRVKTCVIDPQSLTLGLSIISIAVQIISHLDLAIRLSQAISQILGQFKATLYIGLPANQPWDIRLVNHNVFLGRLASNPAQSWPDIMGLTYPSRMNQNSYALTIASFGQVNQQPPSNKTLVLVQPDLLLNLTRRLFQVSTPLKSI